MSDEKISKALGIEYSKEIVKQEEVVEYDVIPPEQKKFELSPDADEDYKLARRTFRELIKKGTDGLDGVSDLAKNLESPRAYEVMATLIKTISDATKDLYDLQKKTKDLKGEEKINENPSVNVDKAVFVGTTAELLKMVKNKNNGE